MSLSSEVCQTDELGGVFFCEVSEVGLKKLASVFYGQRDGSRIRTDFSPVWTLDALWMLYLGFGFTLARPQSSHRLVIFELGTEGSSGLFWLGRSRLSSCLDCVPLLAQVLSTDFGAVAIH